MTIKLIHNATLECLMRLPCRVRGAKSIQCASQAARKIGRDIS
jgi:hypothetical protein